MVFSGSIVEHNGAVYFLPNETDVPVLGWSAAEQRFDCIDANDSTGKALVASLRSLAGLASSPIRITKADTSASGVAAAPTFPSGAERVSQATPCDALYGVLSLGAADAVLLYVTEKKKVASLSIESSAAPHDIFLVKSLEWRKLPCTPQRQRPGSQNSIDEGCIEKSSDEDEDEADAAGTAQPRRLPPETLRRYHGVVRDFCHYVSENDGAHSFLYFSPTLNLAENPKDIIDKQLWANQDTPDAENDETHPNSDASDDDGRAAQQATDTADGLAHDGAHDNADPRRHPQAAAEIFQWNLPLLQAFPSITPAFKALTSRRLSPGQAGVKRTTRNIAAFYVPSFIRGLARCVNTTAFDRACAAPSAAATASSSSAELLMITRLSARFAGTRYNRRGLENGWSGVCANMAMTALWVSYNGAALPRRIGVYEILRGSVPRRWTQPANLTFKPPIRMSSTSSAARELRSHLDLLTKVFPQYDRYYCIDTTSTSKLEKPLSDSFANTAHRLQDRDATTPASQETNPYTDRFFYLKFNVKQKKAKLLYGELCLSLLDTVEELLDDPHVAPNSPTASSSNPWEGFLLYEQNVDADGVATWQLLKEQVLLFRVNCLDNLDRTNLTQSMIVKTVLPNMLKALARRGMNAEAEDALVAEQVRLAGAAEKAILALFAAQGVSISQLYAGTDPHFLNHMLNGKRDGLGDKATEGFLAIRRWYNNNFHDGRKQDAVSLVTGQHNPVRYAAEIENPFSRDLTTMNRLVFSGVALGLLMLVFSFISFLTVSDGHERRIRALLFLGWCGFNVFLARLLMPYQQTFTNRPLLPYAP